MKIISSSSGISLHFPDDELHTEFARQEEVLQVKTYAAIRKKYGIWACNQNKFVETQEDLNKLDCRYMEELFERYYEL